MGADSASRAQSRSGTGSGSGASSPAAAGVLPNSPACQRQRARCPDDVVDVRTALFLGESAPGLAPADAAPLQRCVHMLGFEKGGTGLGHAPWDSGVSG